MWLEGGKLREYGDIESVCDHYAEYVEQFNKMKPLEKRKVLDAKFKERIIRNRKVSIIDRMFG